MNAPHVYVHVPFCARRCVYCDFSIAVRRHVPARDYVSALATEVHAAGDASAATTVYLGGGTPSLLGAEGVAEVVRRIRAPRDLAEFTLEANPDDVTPGAAAAWRKSGVTRLSIGAQSFDPGVLAWMHRTHGPDAIGAAVRAARGAGVASISLDLIFALPDALARDLDADIDQVLALEPDHISLYGLTVEPSTPLGRQVKRGAAAAPPDSRYEDEYLRCHERLAQAGFEFYEVSNAALPGRQAVHNSAYWTGAPYLGLGPSAHSFDGATRWWNEPAYSRWSALLAQGQPVITGEETLTGEQRRIERRYLDLRTSRGTLLAVTEADSRARAQEWQTHGWAVLTDGDYGRIRVRLTPMGWLRLDALAASL